MRKRASGRTNRWRTRGAAALAATLVFLSLQAGAASAKGSSAALHSAERPPASQAAAKPAAVGPFRPLVLAHRGASADAPENTFAAFELALRQGADYIELDVQLSRDGVPFVLHDEKLERTTDGRGIASRRTMRELESLDAGGWFGEAYRGERIPRFEEVLRRYGGKIGLLVELKDPQLQPGLERAVAAALIRFGLTGEQRLEAGGPGWRRAPVIVQSFSLPSLKRLGELMPSVPLGVILSREEELEQSRLHEMADIATYANLRKQLAQPKLVRRVHGSGMAVFVWTVDRRREAVQAAAAGADGIVTDGPDRFRDWIKKTPDGIRRPSGS
ncbi:glycerophosphodiester phosphodiesterase [Paenibacillus sp. B01]|uniref:glycerophosphodiester phosphodiesterase n=1 Tax=Paenibacillus sp. B01 TaxID=2660554 RepID=UPI0018916ED0|nr:glycerophosphodiester phosphodiesterase family protein [Paenibacillus sp. B01]